MFKITDKHINFAKHLLDVECCDDNKCQCNSPEIVDKAIQEYQMDALQFDAAAEHHETKTVAKQKRAIG